MNLSDRSSNRVSTRLKTLARHYFKWIPISAAIGVASGIASAVFLIVLEYATQFRESHPWLLFLLPIGGLIVGGTYYFWGSSVESGNNLLIDEFHEPQKVVPFRMTPLVLFGTIVTHLFGGSAGREGTAVQMGGSIADQFTNLLKLDKSDRRTLLIAGMAGGFGSVFGVPFAGTVFGLEVLAIGKIQLWGLIDCAIAAFVAHHVTLALGVHHTNYAHPIVVDHLFGIQGLYAIAAGVCFGGAARLFAELTELIKHISKKLVKLLPLRACLGGILIALIYFLLPQTIRYSGLGVPVIVSALKIPLPVYDWFGKLVMTALTLGLGFKGGEVTPLLFVGATLGNALSQWIPIHFDLLAAMGFVAVFAGAANTPLACTVMALELFGFDVFGFVVVACFVSYLVSGHRGIYTSQKIVRAKPSLRRFFPKKSSLK